MPKSGGNKSKSNRPRNQTAPWFDKQTKSRRKKNKDAKKSRKRNR